MSRLLTSIGNALHTAAAFLLQWLIRLLVFLVFRPKKLFISENARQNAFREPCIIVSNHIRGMDGAAILTLLPRVRITGVFALDMLDRYKALRMTWRFLPMLPIDRYHPSLSWLRESRRLLRKGQSIYICPEGKCSFDKVVRPFKPGFVTLAASADVPVVPVYHNGEYHPFFGKRFRMMVGEPIRMTPPPEGLAEPEMRREAEEIRQIVRQLEFALNGTIREEETE